MSKIIYEKNAKYLLKTVVHFKGAAFTADILHVNVNKVYNMLQGKVAIDKKVVYLLSVYCELPYNAFRRYIMPEDKREICETLFLKLIEEERKT